MLEREINERLTLGAELFGNSPKERGSRADVAFNLGGAWKLSEHVNFLFYRWTRHRRRYTSDGLCRLAVSNQINARLFAQQE